VRGMDVHLVNQAYDTPYRKVAILSRALIGKLSIIPLSGKFRRSHFTTLPVKRFSPESSS
ncbi:hypothetical protein, partial [Brucella rhizosphaerae]|uniref:hypothetical protein n=1 Tax=Brucella rhizosphaerae TaxID=571254 RepID=UPI001AEC107E